MKKFVIIISVIALSVPFFALSNKAHAEKNACVVPGKWGPSESGQTMAIWCGESGTITCTVPCGTGGAM